MNEQVLFDRLRYMDRLKTAGISEEHARAHLDALHTALRELLIELRANPDLLKGPR
jgi:truncated hemoglobin YjbI